MRDQPTSRARRSALGLLPVPFLLLAAGAVQDAPPPAVDTPLVELRFAVEPGTQLAKSWVVEHALVMNRMAMKIADGERQQLDVRSIIQSQLQLELVDRYDALEGGRPASMRRAYDTARLVGTLKLQQFADQPPKVADMRSPLEGKSVVFTWVPEEQEYGRYYDALEGEEEHLPALAPDTDLGRLLPAAPVRVGETWKVDAQALRDVIAPAGTLHFKAGKSFDRLLGRALTAGVGGGLEQAFGGESDGGVTLVLEGLEERDGAQVARISLAVRAKYGKDQTDFSRENMARREEERGARFISNHLVLELDGKGELLWDLRAGHALQLELDLRESVSMRIVEEQEGTGVRLEQEMEMSGRLKQQLLVAAQ